MASLSFKSKSRTKMLILGLLALVAIVGLGLLARGFYESNDANQVRDIFTEALSPRNELVEEVIWAPDPDDLVRELDKITREQITESWIGAWEAKAAAARGIASSELLETYFSGDALSAFDVSTEPAVDISITQLSHELQATFLSADGQIVGITANNSRSLIQYDLEASYAAKLTSGSYDAVMILEDGNWRVRHLVRTAGTSEWITRPEDIEASN